MKPADQSIQTFFKQCSLLLLGAAALGIALLLVFRFYLMIYYPGTQETLGLFEALLPYWPTLMGISDAALHPITLLISGITPFLSPEQQQWFPHAPAAAFFRFGGSASSAADPLQYPGYLDWPALLAIPFWWVVLGVLYLAIESLPDLSPGALERELRKAKHRKADRAMVGYEDPETRHPSPNGTPVEPHRQPSEPAASEHSSGIQAVPQSEKPDLGAADSPSPKNRLKNLGPPVALPKVYRLASPPAASQSAQPAAQPIPGPMAKGGTGPGGLGVREMMESLRRENMALQSERDELETTFSQYFSPNVLRYLETNRSAFREVKNHKCEVSVLFCDIRGFTAFSQSHSPEEVVEYLGSYFSLANDVILNLHEGVINKLMGDGIMAYWGFPIPTPDHAYRATRAALDILREVEFRNSCLPEGANKLEVGLGLCTGEVLVGNFGSADFKDFTLIGNPVNLASRLDGVNKELNTRVLISEETFQKLEGRIPCHDQGQIEIRGWSGGIHVYEPYG